MRSFGLLLALCTCGVIQGKGTALFPLKGAVFLPHASPESPHYLATIESVSPLVDVAINDAHRLYLQGWAPLKWLEFRASAIQQCDDQHAAAWAALDAHSWTEGSGLDVSFGPSCGSFYDRSSSDYSLATICRINSYYNVAMFTNAGFTSYFDDKRQLPLIRTGPLQNYILLMLSHLSGGFDWRPAPADVREVFLGERIARSFLTDRLSGAFCKLLMSDMYAWTINKQWNLTVNPRIIPSWTEDQSDDRREFFSAFLRSNVGVDYGGRFLSRTDWGNKHERRTLN
ncbi:hypothetical protein M3Y99_01160200 [Aphelenchoides fujianensis]|nr:hypothetical protein M3Y99_01160200 [Aphelenchoides fujianensis]